MDSLTQIRLTRELIDIDSTTPTRERGGRVHRRARSRRLGYDVVEQPVVDGRFNVIARRVDPPVVVFSTHFDCVPPFFPSREADGRAVRPRRVRRERHARRADRRRRAAARRRRDARRPAVRRRRGARQRRRAAPRTRSPPGSRVPDQRRAHGQPARHRDARRLSRAAARPTGRAAHSSLPRARRVGDRQAGRRARRAARRRVAATIRCSAARSTRVGLITGGVAPNVISPDADAELMFRTVGDHAELRRAHRSARRRARSRRGHPRRSAGAPDDGARLRHRGVLVHHRHPVSRSLGRAAAPRPGLSHARAHGRRVRARSPSCIGRSIGYHTRSSRSDCSQSVKIPASIAGRVRSRRATNRDDPSPLDTVVSPPCQVTEPATGPSAPPTIDAGRIRNSKAPQTPTPSSLAADSPGRDGGVRARVRRARRHPASRPTRLAERIDRGEPGHHRAGAGRVVPRGRSRPPVVARRASRGRKRSAARPSFARALSKLDIKCDLGGRPSCINARTRDDGGVAAEGAGGAARGAESSAPWTDAAGRARGNRAPTRWAASGCRASTYDPVRAALGLCRRGGCSTARGSSSSPRSAARDSRASTPTSSWQTARFARRLIVVATGEPGTLFGQLRRHVRRATGYVVVTEPLSAAMRREAGKRAAIVTEIGADGESALAAMAGRRSRAVRRRALARRRRPGSATSCLVPADRAADVRAVAAVSGDFRLAGRTGAGSSRWSYDAGRVAVDWPASELSRFTSSPWHSAGTAMRWRGRRRGRRCARLAARRGRRCRAGLRTASVTSVRDGVRV